MKKMFSGLVLAALAVLPACNSDETVDVPTGRAIEFAGSFVDNSTRSTDPSYTTSSLLEYYVYSWVEKDATTYSVFDNERVHFSKSQTDNTDPGSWTHDTKRYWIENGKYNFFAVAGANSGTLTINNTDAPTIAGFTSDGKTDLIYSEVKNVEGKSSDNNNVSFTFQHQLAKVRFSFYNNTNKFDYITAKVKNIKMTNPIASGDVTLSADRYGAVWSNWQQGETALDFGNAGESDGFIAFYDASQTVPVAPSTCDYERLVIPAGSEQTYKVTFDVDLYLFDIPHKTITCEATIKDVEFKPGYAYNFTAWLLESSLDGDLQTIEFDSPTVEEWTNQSDDNWTIFTQESGSESGNGSLGGGTMGGGTMGGGVTSD
jgi:hypothetical protein